MNRHFKRYFATASPVAQPSGVSTWTEVFLPSPKGEVIEAPVLVERDAHPGVGEARVSGCECDAEAGTPEDGADLCFCPHHTKSF
jgi:hypothetical protein